MINDGRLVIRVPMIHILLARALRINLANEIRTHLAAIFIREIKQFEGEIRPELLDRIKQMAAAESEYYIQIDEAIHSYQARRRRIVQDAEASTAALEQSLRRDRELADLKRILLATRTAVPEVLTKIEIQQFYGAINDPDANDHVADLIADQALTLVQSRLLAKGPNGHASLLEDLDRIGQNESARIVSAAITFLGRPHEGRTEAEGRL